MICLKKKVIFYCFKGSTQKTKVIPCDLSQAHKLFNEEYAKKKSGVCEWDYFDITINGKLLRSSNM